ncbi:MAG TPA: PqqD family protein [Bacteroidetes bacterium]|nr:PqqD family protein [Bacteroidota bacterium]
MMSLRKNIAVSDSGFVFDPSSGESYSLNPIGTEIVKLLQQGRSNEDIIRDLTGKYDVDDATLERYYYDFIGMLKQFNLLENGE